jgi:osmotically-inducible protein OsmY
MKTISTSVFRSLKAISLILSVSLLPMLIGVIATGCADNRYEASPGVKLDDTLISEHVKEAFLSDRQYKFEDVKVSTMEGTVQLSGFVATGDEKGRAEQIAKDVPGVKNVVNNITVK